MPFEMSDILLRNDNDKKLAALECYCIATSFPEKRAEFTKYAEQLEGRA